MKNPFKRKRKLSREQEMANAINNCVTSLIERYKNTPIKVNHNITRNIPRPTAMTIHVETANGQRFNLGWYDLSYKNGMPLILRPGTVLGPEFNHVPDLHMMVQLEYNPSDRRG